MDLHCLLHCLAASLQEPSQSGMVEQESTTDIAGPGGSLQPTRVAGAHLHQDPTEAAAEEGVSVFTFDTNTYHRNAVRWSASFIVNSRR